MAREIKATVVEPTTLASYRWIANTYVAPALGPLPLDKIRALDLDRLYARLRAGGSGTGGELSPRTVRLCHTGVKACGADVTRQCVLDAIADIGEWTAGGLHAPTKPAENLPPACGIVLKLQGAEYVRVQPEEPGEFECDDKYVAEVTGAVVDQAKLGPDRVSTLFTS